MLPDQSSTVLLCKEGQTLRQALVHLCDRRHLSLVAHEVYLGGGDKVMSRNNSMLVIYLVSLSFPSKSALYRASLVVSPIIHAFCVELG